MATRARPAGHRRAIPLTGPAPAVAWTAGSGGRAAAPAPPPGHDTNRKHTA
ncbi:MAG: hypothetical protein JWO31_1237 [Phycisphaerales bacterium]|nr:hypothetical protein [Phycisphaerales bacterium]